LAEIGSELASYDAAVEEAKSRLSVAQEAARREVEKQKAREALDYLDQLLSHAQGADAALRQYLTAIAAVDQCAQRVCAAAGHPSRDIVHGALKRSLLSALTAHRQTFELPFYRRMNASLSRIGPRVGQQRFGASWHSASPRPIRSAPHDYVETLG